MKGFAMLADLLTSGQCSTAKGFVHVDPITADAIDVTKKVSIETLAGIGDPDLSACARDVIRLGKDILWIGVATKDIQVDSNGFTAILDLRFEHESRSRTVHLTADAEHRIVAARFAVPSIRETGDAA